MLCINDTELCLHDTTGQGALFNPEMSNLVQKRHPYTVKRLGTVKTRFYIAEMF